jgi:hypothetical protein
MIIARVSHLDNPHPLHQKSLKIPEIQSQKGFEPLLLKIFKGQSYPN